MLTVELRCPFCKTTFLFSDYDFEAATSCPKCNAFGEAWFFPHRLKGTIFITETLWSIGDHYPNNVLTLDETAFLRYFSEFAVPERQFNDILSLYIEFVKRRFPTNPFMQEYAKANFPYKRT